MDPVMQQGRIYTPNARPGTKVYGERLVRMRGQEFREWSPRRSKLAAYLAKGGRRFHVKGDEDVLYLGASTGTTVSHLSDLLPKGRVFAVEFAARPFRNLLDLCAQRENLVPILSDAAHPEQYDAFVARRVPILYQDIAQRQQARLFTTNAKRFLRPDGIGFLAVKARSINVAKAPQGIYEDVKRELLTEGFDVAERFELDPFERDHAMFVVRRRT